MSKGYVVCLRGFEYDDNIYNEVDGTHPVACYRTPERAEAELKRMELEEFRRLATEAITIHWGGGVSNYYYKLDDLFNSDEDKEAFVALLEKFQPGSGRIVNDGLAESGMAINHFMANAEDALLNEALKLIGLSFYVVKEIEVEE